MKKTVDLLFIQKALKMLCLCLLGTINYAQTIDTVLLINEKTTFSEKSRIKIRSNETIIKSEQFDINGNNIIYDKYTGKIVKGKIKNKKDLALCLELNKIYKNNGVLKVKLKEKLENDKIYRIRIVCKPVGDVPFYSGGIGCRILKEGSLSVFDEYPQIALGNDSFVTSTDTVIVGYFYSKNEEDVLVIKEFFRKRSKNHHRKKNTLYNIEEILIIKVNKEKNLVPNGDFEAIAEYPYRSYENINIVPTWRETLNESAQVYCRIKPVDFVIRSSLDTISLIRKLTNNYSNFIGLNLANVRGESILHVAERVIIKLKKELVKGRKYKFSLKVLASKYNYMYIKSLAIGFIKSDYTTSNSVEKKIQGIEYLPILYTVKLTNNYVTNSKQWCIYNIEFEAKGGENNLIIGSFPTNEEERKVKKIRVRPSINSLYNQAYYFFDDIELTEIE